MQELIDAIKAWPIIIQGALGSALFWLVLLVAEQARRVAAAEYSKRSRSNRMTWLVNEQIRLRAVLAETSEAQTVALAFVFYRASRPALKAGMWLIYGLMMDSIFSPAGLIGYLVSLFYLIRAYALVGPIDTNGDLKARLKNVDEELESLEARAPS